MPLWLSFCTCYLVYQPILELVQVHLSASTTFKCSVRFGPGEEARSDLRNVMSHPHIQIWRQYIIHAFSKTRSQPKKMISCCSFVTSNLTLKFLWMAGNTAHDLECLVSIHRLSLIIHINMIHFQIQHPPKNTPEVLHLSCCTTAFLRTLLSLQRDIDSQSDRNRAASPTCFRNT